MSKLRLGINIDHVATLRNARGGRHPDTLRAASLVKMIGADSLTIHLREDRRHINDEDVRTLSEWGGLPINLEMAATREMLDIGLKYKPHAICIVPEKREERTTEGGLDVVGNQAILGPMIEKLQANGSRVSLFIEANVAQIEMAAKLGAKAFEIHTGRYCDAIVDGDTNTSNEVLEAIKYGAQLGAALGMEVHAGHGITYESVTPIAQIPEIIELNIGHFLVSEALFVGLGHSIMHMRELMDKARA